jgi:hypothetical protein
VAKWNAPTAPVNVSTGALDWALKHVEAFGDTVFLPRAFEYEAIRSNWNDVRTWLTSQDLREWKARPFRRFLARKSAYSFRFVTQLDPLEYLLFSALVYEIGPQLEALRSPASDNTVFSWRFDPKPNGQMYSAAYRWDDFNSRCLSLAQSAKCRWVVVADIADFFPHIYLHPVENALDSATGRSPSAYCLLRMISNWNAFVSYGLPVGLAGSRIIAEATIDDVDKALAGTGRQYCRYSDDIRIFCTSEADATLSLEHLASHLFNVHGLTLQPMKTLVLKKSAYIKRFTMSGERAEIESLGTKLQELLEAAGWEDEYEREIDFEGLPEETQEEVRKLNLMEILKEQIAAERIDPIVTSFVLHRMKQLGLSEAGTIVLDRMDKLFSVIDSVVRYLESLRDINPASRRRIGKRVLQSLNKGATSSYERMCLLSLFTKGVEFDNEDEFEKLHDKWQDNATRREVMFALGRAKKAYWFQARRQGLNELDAWSRRAFIAGYSCVADVARKPYYRSLRGGTDILEKSVINWADANPF